MYKINNKTNLLKSLFIDTGNRLGTCAKQLVSRVRLKVGRNLRLKEALPPTTRQQDLIREYGYPPDNTRWCLQGCGSYIDNEDEHDYCSMCCDYDNPHRDCGEHGEGTDCYDRWLKWYNEVVNK